MGGAETADPLALLDADRLLEEAKQQTGLSDFGPDLSFMTGFRKLVEAVEAMNPTAQLRATAHRNIVGLLATRLRFAEDDKRHPEIAQQDVGDPLIVCGLPRTGTTITYDLLCLDPAARAPKGAAAASIARRFNIVQTTRRYWEVIDRTTAGVLASPIASPEGVVRPKRAS